MSSDDDKKPPMPTFSGTPMPMNISIGDDDEIGEETTRRVGVAPSFAPSFDFQPSFTPGPPSFHSTGSSFSTAPQKAASSPMSIPGPPAPLAPRRAGWVLQDAPTLPEFHPLDRSAVFVRHTPASEVAERISAVLRERSIDAKYDNVKAKAKCRTTDNVDFRVRLYRGRGKYSHGIIVEVQRRFGASVSFCNDAAAILDAAQGKVPPPPPSFGTTAELPLVSDTEDDYEGDSSSSLDFVSKMLHHPGYDAQSLALQTLSSLTDASKMGRKTACGVSSALVEPENDVGAKVVGLVVDATSDEEETFGLRVMAMTILSNAVRSVNGNVPTMLRERLRPVLLSGLRTASDNPRLAFLAAKCIEPLIEGDHDASELYAALESARTVGEARHTGLSRQADTCIRKISRC